MISPPPSVEQLLASARERDPADRAAFLESVCPGLPELRRVVQERLLAEEYGSQTTLDGSLHGLAARKSRADEPPPSAASRFAAGQVIASRFTVVRYIARGGMGEVYEVADRFLQGVHVALKVILPEIASDAGSSQRFEQEVLLARKVTHRNLCPIYDIARSSDPPPSFLFLTMKLLEGETLSARLRRPEAIPSEEKVAIFRQMLAGLTAIHDAGIVHRDIKPNNVMLDYTSAEVCVSIMDFGLARLHEPETTIGTGSLIAGTPGYMAPEILQGDGPSQATDLFALGVLLYQVATGERPNFRALSHSLETSTSLDKADVPPFFIKAVKDFLSSSPARRCEAASTAALSLEGVSSLHQLAFAKRARTLVTTIGLLVILVSLLLVPAVGERVRGILFSSREKHIVVLPFDLAGGDAQTQALGDGLMDSLSGRLSNLDTTNQSLWVVPTKEVRSRKVADADGALREFGATLVVEGSFQRDNGSTHLKLTLVDPRKLRSIGFVDVQNPNGDLGELQDQAVVRLGRLMNISSKEEKAAKIQGTVPRAAYEDYLLALGYSQRFDQPGNLDRAISALQSALKTDPNFTIGVARLAQVYVMKYRIDKNPEWLDQAKLYANQALKADSRIPLAHVALGQIEQYTGHHDLAAQEFQRAIDLDPKDPEALTGLAVSNRDLGRNAEAEAIYIRAANIRPNDWNGYNALGQFYGRIGRNSDAIAQYQHALRLAPDNAGVYANLGVAYLNSNDAKQIGAAEEALNRSISLHPNYWAYANLGIVYSAQNRLADSVAVIQKALLLNDQDYRVWKNLAEGYEWLGDEKNAASVRKSERPHVEQAIKLNPQNADAQATLAMLLAKDRLRADALSRIQVALALEPHNESVLSDVADTYEILGERASAIRYLQQAIANGLPAASIRSDPYLRNLVADPKSHLQKIHPGA